MSRNVVKTREEKDEIIKQAAVHYGNFLQAMGIDWKNEVHMSGTPLRVAKAHVNELWSGLFDAPPDIRSFSNEDGYDGVVFSGNIVVNSMCAHHAIPFFGVCHCAYLPAKTNSKIIGLSKFNRIVDWHSRRPNTQECLNYDIFNHINKVCEGNHGVAIMIECKHMCCQLRGVKQASVMKTSKMSGEFLNDKSLSRQEFYDFIRDLK